MEYEKLSYPETIEKLASMYNFNLDYENSTEKKQDTKILEEINKKYPSELKQHYKLFDEIEDKI